MDDQPEPTRRRSWFRRPRFQFSLASLFVVMTIFAIWLGQVTHRARQQREAVAALAGIGAEITYDWQQGPDWHDGPPGPPWLRGWLGDEYFQEVIEVYFTGRAGVISTDERPSTDVVDDPFTVDPDEGSSIVEDDLKRLYCFPRLKSLRLEEPASLPAGFWENLGACCRLEKLTVLGDGDPGEIRDRELADISRLEHLTCLSLLGATISDDTLKEIGRLRSLRAISLDCSNVTGQGLSHLRTLNDLGSLSLNYTGVDERELYELKALRNLRHLRLSGAEITDHVLANLRGLDKLEHLELRSVSLSGQGIAQLAHLPNLNRLEIINFEDGKIKDEDLQSFALLKSVTWLTLYLKDVTTTGLMHFGKMNSLQTLDLWPKPSSPMERRRVKKSLPGVSVFWQN